MKFRARDFRGLIERVDASGKSIEHGGLGAVNPLSANACSGTRPPFHAARLNATLNYLFIYQIRLIRV